MQKYKKPVVHIKIGKTQSCDQMIITTTKSAKKRKKLSQELESISNGDIMSPIIRHTVNIIYNDSKNSLRRHHGFWSPTSCIIWLLQGIVLTEKNADTKNYIRYLSQPVISIYSRSVYRMTVADLIDRNVIQKFTVPNKILFHQRTGIKVTETEKRQMIEQKQMRPKKKQKTKLKETSAFTALRKRFTFTLRF